MASDLVELWEAWSECQIAYGRTLVGDPLMYSEFEMMRIPPGADYSAPIVPELEFVTRPKQSGGIRLEVFPDVFSSTLLQAAANRIINANHDFGAALSSHCARTRLKKPDSYETWSSSIVPWLKRELSRGRTVLLADIKDYFPSISREQIEAALSTIPINQEDHDTILRLIDHINGTPDLNGHTRTGLPVAPNEIFWLLADLVLETIDAQILGISKVLSYARWIDDLFVSVKPGHTEDVLGSIRNILLPHGFTFNDTKTRQLTTQKDFELSFFAREHDQLDVLFRAARDGFCPKAPDSLNGLFFRIDGHGIQQGRVVKRAYSLASLTRATNLVDRAEHDLASHPTAELAILGYLGSLGWPGNSIALAINSIEHPPTDSRQLGAMRILLRWPPPKRKLDAVIVSMKNTLTASTQHGHPFSKPLALGFLLLNSTADAAPSAFLCLDSVRQLQSVTARRVTYEILLSIPETQVHVVPFIADDPSPTVKGLLQLIRPNADAAPPSRLRSILTTGSSQRLSWGKLTNILATAIIPQDNLGEILELGIAKHKV